MSDLPYFDESNFSKFAESFVDVRLACLSVQTRNIDLGKGRRVSVSVVKLGLVGIIAVLVLVGALVVAISASVSRVVSFPVASVVLRVSVLVVHHVTVSFVSTTFVIVVVPI